MTEVTVVIWAHNNAALLSHSISSVLRQADVAFELWVVDDASTDHSAAVVRFFNDSRVHLLQNKSPRGPAACYNLALAKCQSPFFATLRADCLLRPGALRRLLDCSRQHPDIGMAHGNGFTIDTQGHATRDEFRAQKARFSELFAPTADYRKVLLADPELA